MNVLVTIGDELQVFRALKEVVLEILESSPYTHGLDASSRKDAFPCVTRVQRSDSHHASKRTRSVIRGW